MSERLKYALNGVYRCENFAQHLANDDFPPVPIGSVGGFRDWHIALKIDSTTASHVYPILFSGFERQLHVHFYFNVINKDGSSSFRQIEKVHLKPNHRPRGIGMEILELLNVKNGYLDDGALVVKYGLHVESVLGKDNIWRFNTENPLFDWRKKKYMIQICSLCTDFYVHKQLLSFHSLHFQTSCREKDGNFKERVFNHGEIESFLQICQGVHVKNLDVQSLAIIMNVACKYSFHNVFHYCERQLIENDLKLWKSWVIHWDGFRHYLVHLLKKVVSPWEIIDESDIEKMEGETMKMFVAKFIYNKF